MEDIFLDEEVFELEAEEEKGKLIGTFTCYITSAKIIKDFTSKKDRIANSGKTQMRVDLSFQVLPGVTDEGWGCQEIKVALFGNAQWKMNECFSAIGLPYKEHADKLYKNGKPVKLWQLSQANLIGRGCDINMVKPEGKKYSEPDEFILVENLKVLTQDEIMEIFPVGDYEAPAHSDDDIPF